LVVIARGETDESSSKGGITHAGMKRVKRPDVAVLKKQAATLPSGHLLVWTHKKVGLVKHLARLHNVALPYNSGR
jgi:hypothetical protein